MYSAVGLHFLRAVDVYFEELSAWPSRAATIHVIDPLDDAVNALTYTSEAPKLCPVLALLLKQWYTITGYYKVLLYAILESIAIGWIRVLCSIG